MHHGRHAATRTRRRPSGRVVRSGARRSRRCSPPGQPSSYSRPQRDRRRPTTARHRLDTRSLRRRPTPRRRPRRDPPGPGFNSGQVTAVGDSVMLDYQDPLKTPSPASPSTPPSAGSGRTANRFCKHSRRAANSARTSSSASAPTGRSRRRVRSHDVHSRRGLPRRLRERPR